MTSVVTGNIKIKKGSINYQATINIRKGPNDVIHKYHSTGTSKKREAEAVLRSLIRKYEDEDAGVEQLPEKPLLTVHDFFKDYKIHMRSGIRTSTWEGYEIIIDNHFLTYFNSKTLLTDLTSFTLDKYFDYHLHCNDNPLKASSLKQHRAVWKKALGYAYSMKLIDENPVLAVRLPKGSKRQYTIYNVDEVKRLVDAIKGDVIEPAILLSAWLGLRRGEALGLRWLDIDLESTPPKLTVQNSLVTVKTEQESLPKSQTSLHTFHLSATIVQYLTNLKLMQERERELCGDSYIDSGYVMRWADGTKVSRSTYRYHFKKCLVANGFVDIRLHDLRHSLATILFNKGELDLFELQSYMRHAHLNTTRIYVHMDDSHKTNHSEKIESYFGKSAYA